MSIPPPPPRSNITPSRGTNITPYVNDYKNVVPAAAERPFTNAPTLLEFWRSDARGIPGRKKPRWAGLVAFWVGLLAAALLIFGAALGLPYTAQIALALGAVAGFFGLIGFIAGIGRVLSVFGIIFALVGNVYVLSWLGENIF
ncbi:hypothetical protein BH11ACT3_BH11ACT3_05530 [soil metagenome]